MKSDVKINSYFMNEDIALVELSNDDQSKWVEVYKGAVKLLTLNEEREESVNGNQINVREFNESELRFDDSFGKYQREEGGHIVMKAKVEEIPSEVSEKLNNLFS